MSIMRGRHVVITVTLPVGIIGGSWRLYTGPLPGWEMLGTVRRGMSIGALGASPDAILAQINRGAVEVPHQRRGQSTATLSVGITIPDDIDFAALRMARDSDGHVSFDWAPIERICEASSVDMALFRDAPEDNVGALITAWYRMHLAAGGARDAVQDDLISEVALEDEHGGGLSHQPGRA